MGHSVTVLWRENVILEQILLLVFVIFAVRQVQNILDFAAQFATETTRLVVGNRRTVIIVAQFVIPVETIK